MKKKNKDDEGKVALNDKDDPHKMSKTNLEFNSQQTP